jgi:hypothetical protein
MFWPLLRPGVVLRHLQIFTGFAPGASTAGCANASR